MWRLTLARLKSGQLRVVRSYFLRRLLSPCITAWESWVKDGFAKLRHCSTLLSSSGILLIILCNRRTSVMVLEFLHAASLRWIIKHSLVVTISMGAAWVFHCHRSRQVAKALRLHLFDAVLRDWASQTRYAGRHRGRWLYPTYPSRFNRAAATVRHRKRLYLSVELFSVAWWPRERLLVAWTCRESSSYASRIVGSADA